MIPALAMDPDTDAIPSGAHPERHPVALQVQVDGAARQVGPGPLGRRHQAEALLDGDHAQRLAAARRQGVRLLGTQLRSLRGNRVGVGLRFRLKVRVGVSVRLPQP